MISFTDIQEILSKSSSKLFFFNFFTMRCCRSILDQCHYLMLLLRTSQNLWPTQNFPTLTSLCIPPHSYMWRTIEFISKTINLLKWKCWQIYHKNIHIRYYDVSSYFILFYFIEHNKSTNPFFPHSFICVF